ncbi:hypothetical protein I5677_11395 [Mobilitalea sibirica]|uniref:Uncharacterized protein n=1 Tax=Mobilitalea sibirica TaxID=1462919 RepID=A0A8J7L2Z5_9FIRM|nr:hypothetical protein [Mobilitalea sibirica]MBH1941498.1 hypothetical protein [Mobilitalea sibirica]
MKKIKKSNAIKHKEPMAMKTKALWYSLGGIALLVIVILIIIESASGKIVVKNDTNLNLEYVKAYFVGVEGPISDEIINLELNSGDDFSEKLAEEYKLLGMEANLEIRFKFENQDELFVDAGYFNDTFDGKINIDFTQDDDDSIKLKVKAKNGLLPSLLIQCNEVHKINLEEGIVEE